MQICCHYFKELLLNLLAYVKLNMRVYFWQKLFPLQVEAAHDAAFT